MALYEAKHAIKSLKVVVVLLVTPAIKLSVKLKEEISRALAWNFLAWKKTLLLTCIF